MRRARVFVRNLPVAVLTQTDEGRYVFEYDADYAGAPASLTLPVSGRRFEFEGFPPFFDGLLPEGPQLEALLRQAKLDRDDGFGQLVTVGRDLVGAVTVKEIAA